MKRTIAFTVALCFITVTSAFAQGRAQTRMDFSAKAAGITAVAPVAMNRIEFRKDSAQPAKSKKPFFKTPWPYIIIGAVIVGVVVATQGDGSGY